MASKRNDNKSNYGLAATPAEYEEFCRQRGIKPTDINYPKQVYAMTRLERIIGCGGGKFSGKTRMGIKWLLTGNKHTYECGIRRGNKICDCPYPDNDKHGNPIMVNRSYVYHPKYLFAVLRENAIDLRDWVREAKEIFGKIGGEFREGDKEFHFPSGAVGFCGHYQDEDAFTKYAGLNIVRFLVEEATHIPNIRKRIQMLNSCCRSIYPEMKAQLMLTFNPGGVSHGDILDMFVEPLNEHGEIIKPGTPIVEEYDAAEIYERLGVPKPKEVGEKIRTTRVFVQMTIKDNPSALVNQEYIGALMSMPEEEREAYLFANWHALAGEYFKQFRPNGPNRGEPPEANHVIPHNIAVNKIKPWWWRTMAMDWGYGHECATGWAAHDPENDQLWIEQELVVSQTEPDVVGEVVARLTKPILEGLESPHIVLGLSHDAYGLRQDDRSVAELLARGIGRIIGPSMVHLPDLEVDRLKEKMEAHGQSAASAEADGIFEQIRRRRRMGIVIRRMRDSRIVGWQLIRSLMRWKSSLPDIREIFDPNLASQIAYEKGLQAYGDYVNIFRQKKEVLPKLLIVGEPRDSNGKIIKGTGLGCPRLIAAIPKAVRDETNPEDIVKKHVEGASDLWDMLRYVCMTHQGQDNDEPFKSIQQRKLQEAKKNDPRLDTGDLIHIARQLEAAQAKKVARQQAPIHVLRPSREMRARVRGLIGPPV